MRREGEGEIELPRPVSIVTQAIDLQVVYNQSIDSYEKNQFLIYYTVISEEDKGNSRYSGEIELPRPVSIVTQAIEFSWSSSPASLLLLLLSLSLFS